jgi:hypothetical protein
VFFSAAAEGDDHSQGVAKYPADAMQRLEAGESVKVEESFEFSHRISMARIPLSGKSSFP